MPQGLIAVSAGVLTSIIRREDNTKYGQVGEEYKVGHIWMSCDRRTVQNGWLIGSDRFRMVG